MKISHRAFQKEDVQLVQSLLRENFGRTQHPFLTIDLPNWERLCAAGGLDSGRQQIHLWEVAGRKPQSLVAMLLYYQTRGETTWLVLPEYQELEDEMVQWVEQQHQAVQSTQGIDGVLKCTVCESNASQRVCLTMRGYTALEAGTVFRQRRLDASCSDPALPTGFALCDLAGAADQALAERAAIESQVFGRSLTATFFCQLRATHLYRPELDLMMRAPDGSNAAFCSGWFDEHQRIGFFEPVGTLEAHRRRGLAKALMLEGFRRLRALGATAVYLGHSVNNTAGNRLYQSIGMEVFDREAWWQKELK